MIKISSFLYNADVVPRDHDKFVFFINHYLDQNQLNQLYDLD